MSTVDASLPELETRRAELFQALAGTGDFRRGSVSQNYRRCGKANCACAEPGHPGHGPRQLWTRTLPGGKTTGRQLAPGEVDKVRREIANYAEFAALSQQIVAVNEAICEARPIGSAGAGDAGAGGDHPAGTGREKGGSTRPFGRASPRR